MHHRRFFIPASIMLVLCIVAVVVVINNGYSGGGSGLVGYVGAYSSSGYVVLILIVSITFYMVYEKRKYHKISRGERKIIGSILDEKLRN